LDSCLQFRSRLDTHRDVVPECDREFLDLHVEVPAPSLDLLNVLMMYLNEANTVSFDGFPDFEHSDRAEASTMNPCRDHWFIHECS